LVIEVLNLFWILSFEFWFCKIEVFFFTFWIRFGFRVSNFGFILRLPMPPAPRSGQVVSRSVVAVVLFLAVVAGVAVIVQYLPNWVDRQGDVTPLQAMIKFEYVNYPADGDYLPEFEPRQEGHHDFPLDNITKQDIEAGLDHSSCTCTEVAISAGDGSSWITLKRPASAGEKQADADVVVIPAGGKAKVRLLWKTKERESTLKARLWFQPKGRQQDRQFQDLQASIRVVDALQFLPARLDLEQKYKGEILCWTATRDLQAAGGWWRKRTSPVVEIGNAPPGYEFSIRPLTNLKAVAKEIGEHKPTILSRPKAAFRIKVNVAEENAYLDQGHFEVAVPLLFQGNPYTKGPSVAGYVKSEVVILGSAIGKIDLKTFPSELGYADVFYTTVNPRSKMLTLVDWPTGVDVRLLAKTEDREKWRWILDIRVPPNTDHFPPTKDTIILRIQETRDYLTDLVAAVGGMGISQTGPAAEFARFATSSRSIFGIKEGPLPGTRQVRIPVLGTVRR
jgi:hypothetical protein